MPWSQFCHYGKKSSLEIISGLHECQTHKAGSDLVIQFRTSSSNCLVLDADISLPNVC